MTLPQSATIKMNQVQTLSNDGYVLRRYNYDYRRRDGSWRQVSREVYDRGNGAVILLYDPVARTVVLVRQFRLPTFVNGHPDGWILEAPAGLLDARDPAEAIRREVAEETGYQVSEVRALFSAYMSPGSVSERLHFFAAPVHAGMRTDAGGGLEEENEDIEVVEMPFEEALAKIGTGEIVDAKTIMLLYHARVSGLFQ
ncbi:MAG TPA: NUDIX domain-containing protein [Geminicoccus sp.]|jgi:nudix-type nucleoside diphosphatase (YffH/AdpP family)|uniref:NUDIX domain-containing protein n=1 Tax=Geminicoccus sp. TaxID=2024832 RepID=UPI002E31B9C5|nr:NUDIX domain-containing protein [Geminicoccus sp.]HEX2526328.1 NUDIX domain-containing protein [Geminicoccus sp.]